MSAENILKFNQKAASDPELAAKIQALDSEDAQGFADQMARLSVEAGTPFTADEFLASTSELSEEDMAGIAGGTIRPPFTTFHGKANPLDLTPGATKKL